jgi:zinc transport system substrate-binding protein
MKKIPAIFLVCLLFLTACSSQTTKTEDDKLNIITTIFPQYDLARTIGGDKINVTMLLQPGVDAHSFEPSPSDILKIQNADMFIYTGGQSDNWVSTIIDGVDTGCMFLSLMSYAQTLPEEHEHDHEDHDHEHDKGHESGEDIPEYDEHIWTSISNAKVLADVIASEMCRLDPDNTDFYNSNLNVCLDELTLLDKEFKQIVSEASRKTIIFGDRFPFLYFAKEYGLEYHAAFPGCSSESEPSAATVAGLIDMINREKIPVVFYVELSNKNIARTISEATGAETLLLHSCHNIAKSDFESGITYLSLMKQNAENLKIALK